MAERRMFHTAVVESDAFLDLPVGVQALYFHLCMQADDDSFLNCPRQIARKLRRPPRELQMLVDEGFLLDFDGVMVIKHWRMANSLQNDRIKPLNYPDIAKGLYIKPNKAYTLDNTGDFECLLTKRKALLDSSRNPRGKERKRKEQNRKEKKGTEPKGGESDPVPETGLPEAATPPTDPSIKKAEISLTLQQANDLTERMGVENYLDYRLKLADFIERNNAKINDHYATILKWWQEDRRNDYERKY